MKLPSLQFYPGDWLRDSVAGCSIAAQGLWLRMMFLMHDSERYGYLQQNGSPIPPASIARRCGCTPDEYETLLSELEQAGVPSRTPDGTLYSRRMVRDAAERGKNADRQRRFRHKSPPNNGSDNAPNIGLGNADVTDVSQPSSSSPSTANHTHAHSARADDDLPVQRGSPPEPVTGAEENPAELPPTVEHFALQAHWETYHVGLDIDTQTRVAAAVTDPALWRVALDYWVDNGYRGRSIGKIVKKYRELEAEKNGQRNGTTGGQPRAQYGAKPAVTRDFSKYPARTG